MAKKSATHGDRVRMRILSFIKEYIVEHKYPPTIREIADAVGLSSSASVFNHLKKLAAEGLITISDRPEPRTAVPKGTVVTIIEDEEPSKTNEA